MLLPNSYLRMAPDRSAAHRSDPAQRIPDTRCAASWTGRLRARGAYSGTNPARTVEPYAAEEGFRKKVARYAWVRRLESGMALKAGSPLSTGRHHGRV
jgi:hypothetical protein